MYSCDLCLKEVFDSYKWTLSLNYASYGGLYKKHICLDCAKKKLGIPMERLNFFRCLADFRRMHQKSIYEVWSEEEIDLFKAFCVSNDVKIRDYNIPLYHNWSVGKLFLTSNGVRTEK